MPTPEARRLAIVPFLLAVLGCAAVGCADGQATWPRPTDVPVPRVALATVLAAVRGAPGIRQVPADLTPSLATARDDLGFANTKCEAAPDADRLADPCVFGDRASDRRVVLWGDSHAGMWLPALMPIALSRHWRLEFYGKPACPALYLTFWYQQQDRPFAECDRFRAFVLGRIRAARPALVIVTGESYSQKLARGVLITPARWQAALASTLRTVRRSASRVIVLGDTPVLDQSAPECLAAHLSDVAACATTRAAATARVWNAADEAAAHAAGAGYISVLPWLCTAICTPVVGNMVVYRNRFHLTATYARMLTGVLENAVLRLAPIALLR
jgi:hypothetical protein